MTGSLKQPFEACPRETQRRETESEREGGGKAGGREGERERECSVRERRRESEGEGGGESTWIVQPPSTRAGSASTTNALRIIVGRALACVSLLALCAAKGARLEKNAIEVSHRPHLF